MKEASYFIDQYKKEAHVQEKIFNLHAAIFVTRAIYWIFKKEKEVEFKSDKKSLELADKQMKDFLLKKWFKVLIGLRNIAMKDEYLTPFFRPYLEFEGAGEFATGMGKMIASYKHPNKMYVRVVDSKGGEIKLKENVVDYQLIYEIDGEVIDIIDTIEFCLEDWKKLLNDIENKNLI